MGEAQQTIGYPRDLLQRLRATKHNEKQSNYGEDSEELELNLGLSLGGRFGVEPKENSNKLMRSTSIAGLTTFLREDDAAAPPPASVYPLIRTSSLPMESEEEWRKRKELQSLRRMEAKRKRSEKQKNTRLARDRTNSLERNFEVDSNFKGKVDGSSGGGSKQQQQQQPANGFSPSVTMPFGLSHWATSFPGFVPQQNGKLDGLIGGVKVEGTVLPGSQGSMGSDCSSSSWISEFDSRPVQGMVNSNGEARSPQSIQSVADQFEQKPVIPPAAPIDTKTTMSVKVEVESPTKKKPRLPDNGMRETGMKVMEEMPCVSTKGDGPNGRRIEGFLYKYKNGEEVRIVCVCHGNFLTPAEFVRHAGGGDVSHPMRHILVSSSPPFV